VALVGRGDEAHALALGRLNVGGAPMRRDTIFRITSMTKPITAVAAMMLVEDGRFRLDEPVDRLLPELANRCVLARIDAALDDTVPAQRPITVEDVLTFRLGLGIVFAPPGAFPIQRRIADLDIVGFGPPDPSVAYDSNEWIRRLGELPLMAQPGAQWLYTTGSNVLGVLIERASELPLPAFFEHRILGPLGMKDTGFSVPHDRRVRLATAYLHDVDGLEVFDDSANSRWSAPPNFPQGDAGLVSTVDDFFAFSRLLLNFGEANGRRLLSEDSIRAMTTNNLTASQCAGGECILGQGRGWGYGMAVVTDPVAAGFPAGTYGWDGGFGTSWRVDPASRTTAILMTQTLFSSPEPPAIHADFLRTAFTEE